MTSKKVNSKHSSGSPDIAPLPESTRDLGTHMWRPATEIRAPPYAYALRTRAASHAKPKHSLRITLVCEIATAVVTYHCTASISRPGSRLAGFGLLSSTYTTSAKLLRCSTQTNTYDLLCVIYLGLLLLVYIQLGSP